MAERFLEVVPVTCLVGLLYAAARLVQLRRRGNSVPRDRVAEVMRLLLVCYLTGLVNLVLVPNNFWSYFWFYLRNGYPGGELHLLGGAFNFVPSLLLVLRGELTLGAWVGEMLIGNVLMYAPLGFFLPFVWGWVDGRRIFLVAAGAPLVIELLQPLVGRSFDVDDLACNFLGVLLGYALSRAAQAMLRR